MRDRTAPRTAMMTVAIEGDAYRAVVVVDTIANETSSGGVRIADEVTEEEVRALAREMTLKYSFFQLPRGGAKAGISMVSGIGGEEKRRALRDFGGKLGPLVRAGVYSPGMDINCGEEDLREIYAGAGIVLGQVTDTSFFTAMSVREAINAYQDVHTDRTTALRIAVDGFGRVAAHLTEMLPENQFSVIALSTVVGGRTKNSGFAREELLRDKREHGDRMTETMTEGEPARKEDVLEADADLLLPSSRTWVIHEQNADRIRARAVIPIANVPYTEAAIDALHGRGVVCLPGFVTNAGGVFGSSLFDQGVCINDIEELTVRCYRPLVKRLLEESRERNVSPVRLAQAVAERELRSRKEIPRPRGLAGKVIRRVKKRMQPRRLSSAAALRTLQEDMRRVTDGLGELSKP